jgi:hypothetical protein
MLESLTTPGRGGAPLAISRRPVLPSDLVTSSAPRIWRFRGSIASLDDPLPTLRPATHSTDRGHMAEEHALPLNAVRLVITVCVSALPSFMPASATHATAQSA